MGIIDAEAIRKDPLWQGEWDNKPNEMAMRDEKVINDVLHVRFSPDGKYRPYSKMQLTYFLMEERKDKE